MTDAELQAEYQRVMRRDPGSRATCPSPEQLVQLVERTGPEEERLEILDHAMSCADCHRDLALLQGLHSAQPRQVVLKPYQWLAAASLLIVFAGGVLVTRGVLTHPANEPMRGGGANEGVSLVGAIGPVAHGQPGSLVWHSVQSTIRYDVEVLDSADRVVFSAQTPDTVMDVPALAAPAAAWWVRAELADGTDRRSGITKLTH
jgi:hypothetical protein